MDSLDKSSLREPLLKYIQSGRPYFGICIGMQALFESSDESPGKQGLGVIPGVVGLFSKEDAEAEGGKKSVPHMGWAEIWKVWEKSQGEKDLVLDDQHFFFTHSYRVLYEQIPGSILQLAPSPSAPSFNVPAQVTKDLSPFVHTLSRYGSEAFVTSVKLGNVFGTQFHPEKSGAAGLDLLRRWLQSSPEELSGSVDPKKFVERETAKWKDVDPRTKPAAPTKRVVAALDVRSNDAGDLVVTKGDQYDVREKSSDETSGGVRNLGKPVELARRYYHEGADEICFLNITSFRSSALQDQPMLEVVKSAAESVFVPLTVGGGIKDTIDPDGTSRSALEVAGAYFRSGADKISIGSEAVIAVEEMLEREARGEKALSGKTGIETIANGYGASAVVVSIDPKRVYVDTSAEDWQSNFPAKHLPSLIIGDRATSATASKEKGKAWWYQCTIRGGRETRDIDVVQLAQGVERLGAGEILLNSVDRDGTGSGFDLDLINLVKRSVSIPIVASSGAGKVEHFSELFNGTGVEAGLAAGIFHRREVSLGEVKGHMEAVSIAVRMAA